MDNAVIQVDFTHTEGPRRRRGGLAAALALIVAAALFLLFLKYFLTLALFLGIAAVMAAISTWRLARRRAVQRELFQQPVKGVSLRTYVLFLAAWFIGLIVAVPLVLLGFVVAIIVLSVIAIVAIVLLVTALLNAS